MKENIMKHIPRILSILPLLLAAGVVSAARADDGPLLAKYLFETAIDAPIRDLSGRGLDATTSAPDTCWVNSDRGPALELKGGTEMVMVPSDAFPGSRGSVRIVFRPDGDFNEPQQILQIHSGGSNGDVLGLAVSKGALRLQHMNRTTGQRSSVALPYNTIGQGQWADITASWDMEEGRLRLETAGGVVREATLDNAGAGFAPANKVTIGNNAAGQAGLKGLLYSVEFFRVPAWENITTKDASGALTPEDLEPYVFSNDRLELHFAKRSGALLEAYALQPQKTRLILPAETQSDMPLWSFRLAKDYGRGEGRMLGFADIREPPDFSVKSSDSAKTLIVEWPKVAEVGGLTATVRMSVELPDGESLSYWRMEVEATPSGFGVNSITFPILRLAATSQSPEQMRLISPARWGVAIPDPFYRISLHNAPQNMSSLPYRLTYPDSAFAQFFSLTSPEGTGTYMATHDGEGYRKEFYFEALPRRTLLTFSITHHPYNRSLTHQKIEYPTVFGSFQGDWFDATQLYKKWAIRQFWCAPGPLAARADFPRWLLDCDLAFRFNALAGAAAAKDTALLRDAEKLTEAFGRPAFAVWYNWWEQDFKHTIQNTVVSGKNPGEFQQAWAGRTANLGAGVQNVLEKSAADGVHSMAYINSMVFDQGLEPDHQARSLESSIALDAAGRQTLYNEKYFPLWVMERAAPKWQKYLAALSAETVRHGFLGIYLDSFGRSSRDSSYADGLPFSPGSGLMGAQGQIRLANAIREAIQRVNPDAALSAEANTELFVSLININLYHYNLVKDGVPIWAALYHEYQPTYGRHLNRTAGESLRQFRQSAGNLLVMGSLLGRIFIGDPSPAQGVYPLASDETGQRQFLEDAVTMRRQFHAQLALGTMLRPVRMNPEPSPAPLDTKHYKFDWPDVLTSSWKGSDGQVAVFFVNASEEPRQFSASFTPEEYGVQDGKFHFLRSSARSRQGEIVAPSDASSFPVALAPGEIAAYVAVRENAAAAL